MKILKETANVYGIGVGDIIGKSRKRKASEARHVVLWYLVRCEALDINSAASIVNTSRSNAITSISGIEGARNFDKTLRKNIHNVLVRMKHSIPDKMDTYVISRAYPWGDNMEIEIMSDRIRYVELGDNHTGCQCNENENEIHRKCRQIAELIREIEVLNS